MALRPVTALVHSIRVRAQRHRLFFERDSKGSKEERDLLPRVLRRIACFLSAATSTPSYVFLAALDAAAFGVVGRRALALDL